MTDIADRIRIIKDCAHKLYSQIKRTIYDVCRERVRKNDITYVVRRKGNFGNSITSLLLSATYVDESNRVQV